MGRSIFCPGNSDATPIRSFYYVRLELVTHTCGISEEALSVLSKEIC